jgi:excisionase family DNA binding protein
MDDKPPSFPRHGTTPVQVPLTDRLVLRLPEAVQYCGLSRSTLYALIADKRLKSMKVAGCRVIPVEELRRFMFEEGAHE